MRQTRNQATHMHMHTKNEIKESRSTRRIFEDRSEGRQQEQVKPRLTQRNADVTQYQKKDITKI